MTRLNQSWWRRGMGALAAGALIAGTVYGATPAYATTDTTAPSAPANLQLSPSPTTTDGTVVLLWDQVTASDLSYYQIFRVNGNGASPQANEVTYLGRTDDTRNYFIDVAPTEGEFQYAVMAVDTSGNASGPSPWKMVTMDNPGNGTGTLNRDVTAPAAVTTLNAGAAFQKNRSVTLTWTGVADSDLWRYMIYRKVGNAAPKLVGYALPTATSMTDLLTTDGEITYHILAQDKTGNVSAMSNLPKITVDTAAPAIQVASPVAGQTYAASGSMNISATITDVGGYEASAVRYYLDNSLLASPTFSLQSLSTGLHSVKVEVTDKAGNIGSAIVPFNVGTATVNPSAPQNLTAPALIKTRSVTLTWSAPLTGTVTQYKIYRIAAGSATPAVAGTTLAGVTQFVDQAPADGNMIYYVVAENGAVASPASNTVVTLVDTVAPTIQVTAPKSGKTYLKTGTLDVQYTVTDVTSGYENSAVLRFLDGAAFTGTSINLATLTLGNHQFKVQVTDRAGNVATKTVTFKVAATTGDDDDDDDDDDDEDEDEDDDDNNVDRDALGRKLAEFYRQGKFRNKGHYVSLLAKLNNGNMRQFALHLIKHSGKHFDPVVADTLLEMMGYDDLDIDPNSIRDSEIEGWENKGNPGNPGKGKGNK